VRPDHWYENTGSGFLFNMNKIILIISLFLLTGADFAGSPRYISLAPSTTEILFSLGLAENIVGVSSFCNYPAEAKAKPKAGSFSSPNIEKIISLKPDYIFCTGLEQAHTVQELRRLNFNVYVSDPVSTEELFVSIAEIGKITGRDKEAAELVSRMRNDIAQVNERVKLIPLTERVRVFIEIWHEPLMTAGKGSFVDELISLAGGINVAHEAVRPYCNYSSEKVIELDPQVIILAYMDKEPPLRIVENRFGWKEISAVKNKRVYNDIDPDILLRPGPRITEGLRQLYKKFYETGQ
jgi:iron complex transport system substrate-binding protein